MACVCIVLEDNNVVVHNKGMVGRNDSGWRWGTMILDGGGGLWHKREV